MNFIREFKDRVYWDWISRYQILSLDFIIEFKNYIDKDALKYNKYIKCYYGDILLDHLFNLRLTNIPYSLLVSDIL